MAILDSLVIFLVSLLLGTIGIYAGVRLVADRDIGYGNAALTALLGAAAWGIVSFFVGFIPVLGALLALVVWIGVINWRYPGGWITAAGIGFVAWLVVFVVVYVLATLGLITPDALGVPGI
ncbi:hypothetical protein [Halococcus thailandensis]|uniref:Yip1 domain-containing protein n=1 Tax=Halococcus thailandensis JCM 13552 TaxID=1227457 RepID=M0N104_9EURY|nr:hypothetical protein [Halococcus thailandensis]EMA51506.1 hypothetical protein C451_14615 [Halococcus thailandensis JCM 13552]